MKKIFAILFFLISGSTLHAQFTIYAGLNFQGTSGTCLVRTIYKGNAIPSGLNNSIKSIQLQQGYMVTVAENEDGSGERFTYMATQSAIHVNVAFVLQNKISFIRVLQLPQTPVRKKGAGAVVHADEEAQNVTWFYDWGIRDTSESTREFVPMAWGRNGAGDLRVDSIINKDSLTHYLAFNEPNNASQANMFVNESVPLYKNMLRAGYRMGSPAGTEEAYSTWVDSFVTEANKQKLQVDFVCVHWYDWGNWLSTGNTTPTAAQLLSRLQSYIDNVYDKFGKPIWITEFNANVNRSASVNKAFLELAMPWLDSDPRIERYAFFFEDHFPPRNVDGTTSAIGQSYANNTSALSYPSNVIDTRPVYPPVVLAGFNTSALTVTTSNAVAYTLSPTTLNSRITAPQVFTVGSGNTAITGVAGFWGALNWSNSTANQGITDNRFMSFKLQATTGKTVNYTSIDTINIRVNTNGPNQYQFQYQINNGAFVNITTRSIPTVTSLTTAQLNPIDLTGISALQNVPSTSTVTFRVVPYGASSNSSFAIGNGTTNANNDFAVLGSFIEDSATLYTAPGNALHFDGINDYVTIADANSIDLTTNYTLEAWIRPTSFSAAAGIISKSQTNTSNGYYLSLSNSSPFTGINFDGMQTANGILETGKWYHIAAVKEGTTRTLYVNGVATALTGTGIITAANAQALTIGVHNLQAPKYFTGAIDEVRIWNAARTSSQIIEFMHNTISSSTNNLVEYYNFDNGTAGGTNTGLTTLADQTTSANNGTLTNMALAGSNSNWVESYAMVIPDATAQTGQTGTQFTANWAVPSLANLQNITNYLLDVSSAINFSSFVSGYAGLSVTGTAQNVTGLTSGTTYYYRVRANKASVDNQGGFSETITVSALSNNADLSALTISNGAFAPIFAANTTNYSVSYLNNVTSITVTPTKSNAAASIQVSINGGMYSTVSSGAASTSLALNVGANTINILVTAEDATTKLYIITATREINTWTGATSNNYNNAANWTGNAVPTINDDVLIPDVSGVSNRFPQVNGDGNAQWLSFARNITINPGASLAITNNSGFTRYGIFRVAGNIINNGTLTVTSFNLNGGTVEFVGTTAQTIAASTFASNSIYNLTINNAAGVTLNGNLTVNGALTLSQGNFTTNNFLRLSSTANRTARVPAVNGTISGNVTVERFLPARRSWRFLTAPVTQSSPNSLNTTWQTQVDIFGPSGSNLSFIRPSYNFYTFNSSLNSWMPINNPATINLTGASLNQAFGVFVAGPNGTVAPNSANVTLTSVGELLTGTKTFSYTAPSSNYILVPNPYVSPIDLETVYTASSGITNTFYTWDPRLGGGAGTGGYITIQRNGVNDFTIVGGSANQLQFIQSGQAFFVQANASSQSIVFNETAKVGNTNSTVGVFGVGTGNTDLLRIGLSRYEAGNVVLVNEVVSKYNNTYSKTVSINEDAPKLWNNEENIYIQREGSNLSIENRPFIGATNDSIFIGLNNLKTNANYSLELSPSNWDAGSKAFLVDKLLSTETIIDLNANSFTYLFTSTFATTNDRFLIVFKGATLPNKALNLSAEKQANNSVKINWEALQEVGVKEYALQKSNDGINFKTINNQQAKNGGLTQLYTYTDKYTNSTTLYYRVMATQLNDVENYSKVITITFNQNTNNPIRIFPNPVKGNQISLQLQNVAAGKYTISVINMQGKEVHLQTLQLNGSNLNTIISPSSKLPKGTYSLQVVGSKRYIEKFIVE